MFMKSVVISLGLASAASAALLPRAACNADLCLRSLRATQFPTRLAEASVDCTRILYVTVTPSAVTSIDYSTISQTDTSTIPDTRTDTFYDTSTSIVKVTKTVVSVSTTTDPALAKRVTSVIVFPQYATACSGIVRFSSACSCIGVTARTITADVPTTTVTLPSIVTKTTSITETILTTSITITDATIVKTTTDATTTSYSVTAVPPPVPFVMPSTVGSFKLQIYVDGVEKQLWLAVNYGISQRMMSVTNNLASAGIVTFDSSGWCWASGFVLKGPKNFAPENIWWSDPGFAVVYWSPFVITWHPTTHELRLVANGNTGGELWSELLPGSYVGHGIASQRPSPSRNQIITIRAISI